jgi:hypothetical protein
MEQNPISILSSEEITEHLQEQKTKLVDDFFLTEHLFDNLLDELGSSGNNLEK